MGYRDDKLAYVSTRVSIKQKEAIEAHAKKLGWTVTELIRSLLFKELAK